MASVDGARSLTVSSEEAFQFECSPCEYGGITKEAKYFCSDCDDYLCDSCKISHERIKSSRNHKVAAFTDLPATCSDLPLQSDSKVIIRKPVLCSCNEKPVASYCQDHNDVVCSDCKVLSHRSCKTSPIDEVSKNLANASMDSTINRMHELRDKLTALQKRREKDLKCLKVIANMRRDEVGALRADIDTELDKMEENTLADISEYERKQKEVIEEHIKTCATGVSRLESSGRTLTESKNATTNTDIFIYNLRLSKVVEDLNTVVAHINKEAAEPDIKFVNHADLIKSNVFNLGEVKGKSFLKQTKAIGDMQIASSTKVSVNLSSDTKDPWITGALFLSTAELLLCDNRNQNIKLLDRKLSLKEHIELQGKPWDVSKYNDENVIITRPNDKKLQFIRVSPTLESGQSIQLEKCCYGVVSHLGHIYVSFSNGAVRELDQSGVNKRNIGPMMNRTGQFLNYITVSTTEKIYITTDLAAELLCWSLDGNQIFRYTDSDLKSSTGMYVDTDGSTLVCGRLSNNVHLVDKTGKKLKIILSSKDGVKQPYTVSFRHSDQTLVVSCCDGPSKLLAFKLE